MNSKMRYLIQKVDQLKKLTVLVY